MNCCYCLTCSHCHVALDPDEGHQHVYVGDADDNLRLSLCPDCLAELKALIAPWCPAFAPGWEQVEGNEA